MEPFLYFLGLLITGIELILQIFNRSFCTTDGCKAAGSYVKGGELVLLITGTVFFAVVFVLSLAEKGFLLPFSNFYKKPVCQKYFPWAISFFLTLAMAVEGYLAGFQFFITGYHCPFCLVIAFLLFVSCMARLILSKRIETVFAFACFFVIFFITYFVNPSISPLYNGDAILVYSKNCPHCQNVINYCRENNIRIKTIEVNRVLGVLRSLGLEQVPVLFCNYGEEKRLLVGESKIKEYLASRKQNSQTYAFSRKENTIKKTEKQKPNEDNTSFKRTDEKESKEFQNQKDQQEDGFCPVFTDKKIEGTCSQFESH